MLSGTPRSIWLEMAGQILRGVPLRMTMAMKPNLFIVQESPHPFHTSDKTVDRSLKRKFLSALSLGASDAQSL